MKYRTDINKILKQEIRPIEVSIKNGNPSIEAIKRESNIFGLVLNNYQKRCFASGVVCGLEQAIELINEYFYNLKYSFGESTLTTIKK